MRVNLHVLGPHVQNVEIVDENERPIHGIKKINFEIDADQDKPIALNMELIGEFSLRNCPAVFPLKDVIALADVLGYRLIAKELQ